MKLAIQPLKTSLKTRIFIIFIAVYSIVTMDGAIDKTAYTKALLDTVIKKDICKRYKVRYPASLRQVADTVIDNFCQEINFENIRETYAIRSVQTVKNYVSYLNTAYLARILHKYSFKSVERQSNLKSWYAPQID